MKKLYYLIVIVLISSLVLTGCLLSNVGQVPSTEQSGITYLTNRGIGVVPDPWPFEFPLYAGQDILVGTVYVWNDDVNLYVKYFTTGDWEMTETHLAVADLLANIPQTKTFNPIPGQFPYSTIHDPAVTEFTYTIPLAWDPDTPLFIAAHAKVQLPELLSAPIVATIYSSDLLDNVLHIGEDPLNLGYPTGYTVYPYTYAGSPGAAVLTWKHPSWPTIIGAQWISSALLTEDPRNNSWRLFTRNFEIPLNAINITGSLMMMTADNAEEVHLNGTFIGIDGEVYGDFVDNYEWQSIIPYSGLNLLLGINTLEVMVRNYAWPTDDPEVNPTGLIYKMDYQYQIVERELQTESAWGAGEPEEVFSGKNWATYFTYTPIEFPFLVDTVTVNADNATPTLSSVILQSGKNYRLEVNGIANAGDTIDFDAKYSITYRIPGDTWTDLVSGYESYGPDLLGLSVDGVFVDWGVYNELHVYYWNMVGGGSPVAVALRINDIYYPNNTGYLTVEIYWMP